MGNLSNESPLVFSATHLLMPTRQQLINASHHSFLSEEGKGKTMDREQEELQFLGFCGIFKESFKIILTWRKIFSQITLALILPLSFIFLAHMQISQLIFFKIIDNQDTLDGTQVGTAKYAKLSDIISSEWTAFCLFKFAYFTFLLILSLLSTSAVVYTIACIYTAKPVTLKNTMSVVPKVWKRLMVTFLWSFAAVVLYNIVSIVVLIILFVALVNHVPADGVRVLFLVVLVILYSVGLLYITIVWHLASVISVLEDFYGIKAMMKSKELIKGKMGIAAAVFIVVGICFVGIQFLFETFVVLGWPVEIRIAMGLLCLLLLFKVILFGLVIQTVLYFVCKSYHHENIDKSSLSDHLEVYLGEYVPLKSKDVQMEQFEA
ncbi:polyadenylate-binding protein B-binding protein [Salix suchowensis]|nr:polyadenylate-binding protein B-binding protein [Salix suchowensis]